MPAYGRLNDALSETRRGTPSEGREQRDTVSIEFGENELTVAGFKGVPLVGEDSGCIRRSATEGAGEAV